MNQTKDIVNRSALLCYRLQPFKQTNNRNWSFTYASVVDCLLTHCLFWQCRNVTPNHDNWWSIWFLFDCTRGQSRRMHLLRASRRLMSINGQTNKPWTHSRNITS